MWTENKSQSGNRRPRFKSQKWVAPPGMLKLNCDGAYNIDNECGGVGMIISVEVSDCWVWLVLQRGEIKLQFTFMVFLWIVTWQ